MKNKSYFGPIFLLSILSNSCVAGNPYFNMSDVQNLKSALSPALFKCVTSRENLFSGVPFRTNTNRAVQYFIEDKGYNVGCF